MIVSAALQQYADRGVFRGLSARRRPGGRCEYRFTWLTPRAFTLRHDPARRVLAFQALCPRIGARSPIAAALRRIVAERSTARVPGHKRLDRRKASVTCAVRRGNFSLTMRVRGPHEAYAVRQLLSLVNDLFLALHESYPDYLVAQFGLSAE